MNESGFGPRASNPAGDADSVCYRRTAKGDQEIVFRNTGLDPELRNLLLLINGRRDIPSLAALVPMLRTSLEILQLLEDQGYIELDMAGSGAGMAQPMAPQQTAWPQAAPRAPAPAPAPPAPRPAPAPPAAAPAAPRTPTERADLNFAARREQLMQHLAVLLGADYGPVGQRLQTVRDPAELAGLEKKLFELVKLYRGPREAQVFADKFKITP